MRNPQAFVRSQIAAVLLLLVGLLVAWLFGGLWGAPVIGTAIGASLGPISVEFWDWCGGRRQ